MIHRFPIPFADGRIPDLGGWLHNWGWEVTEFWIEHDRLHSVLPRYEVTLRSYGWPPATMRVSSGAVLVYDDVERTLGVTDKQPEPEPEDAIPSEPEDAILQSFVEGHAAMSLLHDRSYDGAWRWPWPLGPRRGAAQ